MKKTVIIMIFLLIIVFLILCCNRKPFRIGEDCENMKPLDKITVTGKIVYEDNKPLSQCYVYVRQHLSVGYIIIEDTTTNVAGEFFLEFSPRQDKDSYCSVTYGLECKAPEGYYATATSNSGISKYVSEQQINFVIKKQIVE